jgi:probable phosphoglycerate mutase
MDSRTLPNLMLIRHGDTDWTDSRQHTGRTDLPLNAKGEQNAHHLRDRLKGESFARIFTSPLIRASRTCEIAGFSSRAEINPDLMEWDYGDYEGRRTSEIIVDRPDWSLYRDGAPNGESINQVVARADRFVQLARSIDGNVAAFSSGHIIRMIAARWLGLPAITARCFYTATSGVSILGYEHDIREPVVLLWNSITQD